MRILLFSMILVSVSIFGTTVVLRSLENRMHDGMRMQLKGEENRFSVVWKGFLPSYDNTTADYYICINDLKDTSLTMNIALQIQNFENSSYYFAVDGYILPSYWTATAYHYGLVGVDDTVSFAYSNLARQKPTSVPEGIMNETVTLVVRAYHDPLYSLPYSQDTFDVHFHFIDLTSPSWTVLYYDNFDDGATQGWGDGGYSPSIYEGHESTDVTFYSMYRSWPGSLRLRSYPRHSGSWYYERQSHYNKTFDTNLGYSQIYMIYSIRSENYWPTTKLGVDIDGTTYFQPDTMPDINIWYRFTIPLWEDPTLTIDIWAARSPNGLSFELAYAYLDDVYIIAK